MATVNSQSTADPYAPDDASMLFKNYMEFKLGKNEDENLTEIEKSLSIGKIDSSNKEWMLEYLTKLHQKISEIKKSEYAQKGEDSENVNKYLERIVSLKNNIEKIR